MEGEGVRRVKGEGCGVWGVGCALHIVFIAILISCSNAYSETVSSRELIDNAKALDGKVVVYRGEVITQVMGRGEYSWANISDGNNAIGVWCRSAMTSAVKFVGGYKHKGDTVEVRGVFNRACPAHGGELDIHAERVDIVKAGYEREERINRADVAIPIALFLGTLAVVFLSRRRI